MKELELNVEGMVCGGCEKRVVNTLTAIDGVSEVVANHQTGIVSIKMAESVNIEELKEKIEDLGFEVK